VDTPDLRVQVAGLTLQNPIIAASGTCGYGEELHPFVDLNCLGAVVVKGLSLKPTRGNPAPRLVETTAGMLNSVGLHNIGIEAFLTDKLPRLRRYRTHIVANFFGDAPAEYAAVAERASDAEGIAALEANISCPNVQHGGMLFSGDPRLTFEVVERVRKVTSLPLLVKLSPNVTDIALIARAAEEAGADALSLINTIMGMAIDLETRTPRLPLGFGGLSGPAIKPVALRMVWQVAQAVHIPVIGLGGIMTGEDALEFLVAGATACQVGTASFIDPAACRTIVAEMTRYLQRHHIATVAELCGSLRFQHSRD
jgi:dihydroorotate dehydrogenase (NAD+) catalytic subunit